MKSEVATTEGILKDLTSDLVRCNAWPLGIPSLTLVRIPPKCTWEVRLLPGVPVFRIEDIDYQPETEPTVVLTIPETVLLGLRDGEISPRSAVNHVRVEGDPRFFHRVAYQVLQHQSPRDRKDELAEARRGIQGRPPRRVRRKARRGHRPQG